MAQCPDEWAGACACADCAAPPVTVAKATAALMKIFFAACTRMPSSFLLMVAPIPYFQSSSRSIAINEDTRTLYFFCVAARNSGRAGIRGCAYGAYLPALEADYRVGHAVVSELLSHWDRYQETVAGASIAGEEKP